MLSWWHRRSRRKHHEDLESLRARFERFRHLLGANNQFLDLVADAGEKLGGDYLFDRHYLEQLAEKLERTVTDVIYDLNAVAGGRYHELVRPANRVSREIRRILAAREHTVTDLVLTLDQVGWEYVPAVGSKMAALSNIRHLPGIDVPEGFVATVAACRRQFETKTIAHEIRDWSETLRTKRESSIEPAAAALQSAVRKTPLDREVVSALKDQLDIPARSVWRYAVRSSAVWENSTYSFAGQYATMLNVHPGRALDAYREVLASLFAPPPLRYCLTRDVAPSDAAMAVGFVSLIDARASGVVHTLDPAAPERGVMVVSASWGLGPTVAQGTSPVDHYILSRGPHHHVLARELACKVSAIRPCGSGGVEAVQVPREAQSIPCLSDDELLEIAAAARQIERRAGLCQEIEFALDQNHGLFILQARTLEVARTRREPSPHETERLAAAIAHRNVLLDGRGVIACRGVATGSVVVIESIEDAGRVREGDIIVTHSASPRLAVTLDRAAAVITEVGATAGHFATVARELRIPLLVGVEGAREVLHSGLTVTVDAEQNIVYEGTVRELLHYHLTHEPREQAYQEFRLLRRMMKQIATLNLTDPDAADFRADSCRTYHDVVRFAHEMAVRELIGMSEIRSSAHCQHLRRLRLDIPLDLHLVDIGGGLEQDSSEPVVEPGLVRSAPLKALLEGLTAPGSWSTEPVHMDLRGFFSSAARPDSVPSRGTPSLAVNLAVISEDYLNLHLHLGYHFNMVDARLSETSIANYIYFRFIGGVTDLARRSRRARLVGMILQEYDFTVETKGDLLIGRLRDVEAPLMHRRLVMVGRLIGFSRQLDILMHGEHSVREYAQAFLKTDPSETESRG